MPVVVRAGSAAAHRKVGAGSAAADARAAAKRGAHAGRGHDIHLGGQRKEVISLEGVRKSYMMGTYKLEVLRGIDLTLDDADFVAIMGPSGSGKSTLLHILGLL